MNKTLIICSKQKLINEERNQIEEITRKNGYIKGIVQKIYKKTIKILNIKQSGQKNVYVSQPFHTVKQQEIQLKRSNKIQYKCSKH